jgi:UDP-N-acetylglucosamine acyltransferase
MARPFGINTGRAEEARLLAEAIAGLKRAYKTLYRKGLSLEEAWRAQSAGGCLPRGAAVLDFIARSKRGIIR